MDDILLSEAVCGKEYLIKNINGLKKEIENQLKNFGIMQNEKIELLKYNYLKKSFLVKVSGVNYVIDKSVADLIVVRLI